jgi:hypothetical protein
VENKISRCFTPAVAAFFPAPSLTSQSIGCPKLATSVVELWLLSHPFY